MNKIRDITLLEAGATHFLALKQRIRPPLREWTVEQVIEWLPEAGFEACKNVVKYSKITGEVLKSNLSRDFMISTLGIIGENEQTKL